MDDAWSVPLLAAYARTREKALRDQIAEGYLPLCRHVARRFAHRGAEAEDLEQVAALALLGAIDRFEAERGLKFSTFAMATLLGAVRNYLRDHGSTVRLGRDTRSRLHQLSQAEERLTQRLRRIPSLGELAEELSITPDALLALLDLKRMAEPLSMEMALDDTDTARRLENCLGITDAGFAQAENRQWLQWVLSQVTPQEKLLLEKRFVERLGQRETARVLGVSQMQVSRMERRLLTRLRTMAEE